MIGSAPTKFGTYSSLSCRGLRTAMARTLAATALLAALAVLPATAATLQSGSTPEDVALLVERAGVFVNRHNYERLDTVCTAEARKSFGWARNTTEAWKAEVLPVLEASGAPNKYMAVFHTWHTCEADGDHVYKIEKTPTGLMLGAELAEADAGPFRIKDHQLKVQVTIGTHTVNATDRARFVPNASAVAGTPAMFRISEDYTLKTLKLDDASGAAVPFKQVGGVVDYVPPATGGFKLAMEYSGQPNHKDGDFVHLDEVCLCSYWYPHTARLPVTYTVTADAPRGWAVVPQGEPTGSVTSDDGGNRLTYHSDLPVSYLTLDIGRYSITTAQVGGHTLSAYLLDSDPDVAKACIDVIAKSLAFYEKNFGKFPFSRYAVVQSRWVSDMALEAYAFATYGPRGLPELIPHELSHTWWGGRVVCPYTKSMWNEAFAEYSDSLFRRSLDKESDGTQGIPAFRRVNDAFDHLPVAEAFDTNDRVHASVGYDKGSQVMRALEGEIGLETLLKSMRTFLEEHPAGEIADWPEFEAAVNKVAGKDMRWFFHQWLEQTGLPSVQLRNMHVGNNSGKTILEADVVQTGMPYRMTLECAIRIGSGTKIVPVQVRAEPVTHVSIALDGKPSSVRLNPRGIVPLLAPANAAPGDDAAVYTVK